MILTVLLLTLVSSCLTQPADKNAQQRAARAPQGQIQYSGPDGLKVDWKLWAPKIPGRTEALVGARSQRQETGTAQASFTQKQQVVQQPIEHQPQYQPYSAVPSHIKQLIVQAYSPQGPYVDPGAFFYQAPAASHVPAALHQSQSKLDQAPVSQAPIEQTYFNSAVNYRSASYGGSSSHQVGSVPSQLGGIKYKDEERLYQRSAEPPYGSVLSAQSQNKPQYQPYKQIQASQSQYQQPTQPQPQFQSYNKQTIQPQLQYQPYNKPAAQSQYQPQYQQVNKQLSQPLHFKQNPQPQSVIKQASQINLDKNMPSAIQTLLSYQAQLPYNVIANHILYRPKQLFIPKPLPESAKLGRQYPSKIYFVKTDGEVYDGPEPNQQVKQEKRY